MSGAVPVLAFLVCWGVLAGLLGYRAHLPMDHPNARSLHTLPTPRVGGLGIMAALALALLWPGDVTLRLSAAGALVLAAVSWVDDVRGLSVGTRLVAHGGVAAFCLVVLGLTGGWLVFAMLVVVWATNLYNFMDGADGLAGGMATMGFGALAFAAWMADAQSVASLCGALAGASLAFLCFNFPPARLFMGDTGSIPLGFLAAVIGVLGVQRGIWAWPLPLLVFLPFVADASVTLVRRLLARENITQAHRSHYYQRVVLMGATHRQLAWAAYGLMLAMAALALAQHFRPQWSAAVVLVAGLIHLVIFSGIDVRWRQFQR